MPRGDEPQWKEQVTAKQVTSGVTNHEQPNVAGTRKLRKCKAREISRAHIKACESKYKQIPSLFHWYWGLDIGSPLRF